VQPFFCDVGSLLTAGVGFDGFKADGQIAFTRAPVLDRPGKLCLVFQVFVGRGDGAFNRSCQFRQLCLQVPAQNWMPVEMLVLNQFDRGEMCKKNP